MKNEDEKPSGALLAAFYILFIPGMWWSGFAISTMWRWFLVPLGVPGIGVAQALGIVGTIHMIRANMVHAVQRENVKWTAKHFYLALFVLGGAPALGLGMGRLYLWLGTL
jgi:hypothetical protein